MRPQGINGELKIKPFTDNPERFLDLKTVFAGGTQYEVKNVRILPSGIFISFLGVSDRDDAEKLRNKLVEIERENAITPEEGRYFIVDLIGSKIVLKSKDTVKEFGTLKDILQYGSADVYVAKTAEGEVLFPALYATILDINIADKIITLDEMSFLQTAVFPD